MADICKYRACAEQVRVRGGHCRGDNTREQKAADKGRHNFRRKDRKLLCICAIYYLISYCQLCTFATNFYTVSLLLSIQKRPATRIIFLSKTAHCSVFRYYYVPGVNIYDILLNADAVSVKKRIWGHNQWQV